METGVFCAFSGRTPPDMMAAQVRAIEDRGFHCIWVPEHVVLFDEYESRYPYAEDGRLPGFGTGIMEPFTALSFVAANTKRVSDKTSRTSRTGHSLHFMLACVRVNRAPLGAGNYVATCQLLSAKCRVGAAYFKPLWARATKLPCGVSRRRRVFQSARGRGQLCCHGQ